jgi:hypothetical protein
MRESAYDKATRLLTEARVTVQLVYRHRVFVRVRGADRFHSVTWNGDQGWRCSCPAMLPTCSHVFAAQRVIAIPPEGEPS